MSRTPGPRDVARAAVPLEGARGKDRIEVAYEVIEGPGAGRKNTMIGVCLARCDLATELGALEERLESASHPVAPFDVRRERVLVDQRCAAASMAPSCCGPKRWPLGCVARCA